MKFYKKCIISTFILLLIFLFPGCIFEGSCYTSNDNDLETISTIDQEIEKYTIQLNTDSGNAFDNKENIIYEEVIVSDHIDGDTVYVTYPNGEKKKLRFIGIDAPEIANKIEFYGKEASEFTKEKLLGETVYLQKDISNTDRYDRLLRYVWLDIPENPELQASELMFNAILLLNGFAEAKSYSPDTKYMKLFYKFQEQARKESIGIWSVPTDE